MSINNDLTKKRENHISLWKVIIVILPIVISFIAFHHDKQNSPLIISCENWKLVEYGNTTKYSLVKYADPNTDNANGSHTPSISNITGDKSNSPIYIDENNLLELKFQKKQGDASRIYIVNFNNSNDLTYQLTEYNMSESIFDDIQHIFTIHVPITVKETTIEDTDSYGETTAFSVPCLQRFALAFIDYNGNTCIYYIVLRPKPIINEENYEFFSFINHNREQETLIYDIKNWTYDVAFIDCSITNTQSIRQTLLDCFNSGDTSVEQFQYYEAGDEFLSSFSLFPDEQPLNTSIGTVTVIPKTIVIHDTLDIETDLQLLRTIENDRLT